MSNQWSIKSFIILAKTNEELLQFCKDNDILVEGYSPIATGRLLDNADIKKNCRELSTFDPSVIHPLIYCKKTFYHCQKSVHEEYILDNAKVDFTISDEDMAFLDQL
jgi:diketogulonate reductase-like aldo/keto reductase